MATIVYLDVDDEITSAAARLRAAGEPRVALVLPYGSRLATSRMNFRLLAREATSHARRLTIVAPDAGTRALAASAGLPVFTSVAEFEESLGGSTGDEPTAAAAAERRSASRPEPVEAVPVAPPADGAPTSGLPVAEPSVPPVPTGEAGPRPTSRRGTREGRSPRERPADESETATLIMPAPGAGAGRPPAPAVESTAQAGGRRRPADLPVARPRRRVAVSASALAGAGILALAVLAAGVAAYVFLPSATITIRPKVETVHIVPFTVTADPEAPDVDPVNGVIPAIRVELPVSASVDVPATGERVDEARATGSIRFESINTVGPVAVPEGTRVSTLGGIIFVTTRAVTVPPAQVAGERIERGIASAPVRARNTGPEGNVEAGDITQVPDFLRTQQVSAINPEPTSGGKRDVFPIVQQADVDAAIAALRDQLETQFATVAADPPGVPEGATTFPESATIGDLVFEPDPTTLVGQEVPQVSLAASATGTVLAVDEEPLAGIAESRVGAAVTPGRELVEGSIAPTVSVGTVAGGAVQFTLSATASEIAVLDPAEIEELAIGRPLAEVEQDLAALGDVSVTAWPDFVTTVPTIRERVDVVVEPAEPPASGTRRPGVAEAASGPSRAQPVPSTSMSRLPSDGALPAATDHRARLRAA